MSWKVIGLTLLLGYAISSTAAPQPAPAPNGITLPSGYADWRLLGVSQRTDNESLRAILGNDIAIIAARNGDTHPWPDGTVFAKLVWKDATHRAWPAATVPGKPVHVEFMIKDTTKFTATGGWGFARWLGAELQPYGQSPDFAQECYGCHQAVKDADFVFTAPVVIPRAD